MINSQLKLTVVSQDQKLLETEVDSITAPGSEGELTVLPHHVSLFTRLVTGELIYRQAGDEHSVVVSKGFLDVNIDNTVTVMVDNAVTARDISIAKAEEAVKEAQETLAHSQDRQELLLAEASLRRAMLEVKVAHKSKKSAI